MGLTLREGRAVMGEEIVIERPDGVRRNVLPHPRPILSPSGEVLGAINMLVDITTRKEAEVALHVAKESAEAANHSKDRFLAILSHELRTPLTPVLMAVASMEVDPDLPEAMRSDIGMIRRNVEVETRLIDDLLDLSRIASGKMRLHLTSVDMNKATRDVCDICRLHIAERNIHLHVKLDHRTGNVEADPARLRQILWNILKNAIKFTPPGGSIVVRTLRKSDGYASAEVRDTGMGIAPEDLPRIFEAFGQASEQITREYGGMGLGLAISKALVELHHGKLEATSAGLGKGATFMVELPRATSADVDYLAAPRQTVNTGQQLRLLLVEDHADTSDTLCRLLRGTGYAVRTCSSVAEALERIEHETFDLIVSDLGLPDASGYELMRQIRTRSLIKGIAMSGYGMEEDVQRSRDAGFSDHLVKPIKLDQLEQAIRRVLHVT